MVVSIYIYNLKLGRPKMSSIFPPLDFHMYRYVLYRYIGTVVGRNKARYGRNLVRVRYATANRVYRVKYRTLTRQLYRQLDSLGAMQVRK